MKMNVQELINILSGIGHDECTHACPHGFMCTLPADHPGDEHVAHGPDGEVLHTWRRVWN